MAQPEKTRGLFGRCLHVWGETTVTYTPAGTVEKLRTTNEILMARSLFGMSVIKQRCTRCGTLHTRDVTGDAR